MNLLNLHMESMLLVIVILFYLLHSHLHQTKNQIHIPTLEGNRYPSHSPLLLGRIYSQRQAIRYHILLLNVVG